MIDENKIDDIICINVKDKMDRVNYRGVFAMYIMTKDKQTRSLVKTVTKKWKKQKTLLKLLDDFIVPSQTNSEDIPNYYA